MFANIYFCGKICKIKVYFLVREEIRIMGENTDYSSFARRLLPLRLGMNGEYMV